MITALLVVLAVAVTYAINTWKIRQVAKGRALLAATLEAAQGFLYMYVLVKVLSGTRIELGIGAYVVGAFVGTITAMVLSRCASETVEPHHHDCCPPHGRFGVPTGQAGGQIDTRTPTERPVPGRQRVNTTAATTGAISTPDGPSR